MTLILNIFYLVTTFTAHIFTYFSVNNLHCNNQ